VLTLSAFPPRCLALGSQFIALFSLLGTTYGGISAFTFGPGLDELGISIGGVRSPAAATLDRPIGQEDAADAP
jgi:microcystin-dependent protein